MIKSYIRKQGHPHGVVVAIKNDNGGVSYGYSLCNPRDRFDKKLGTKIALERAKAGKEEPHETGRAVTVAAEISILRDRAKKYFKI